MRATIPYGQGCDHEVARAFETHPKAIPWDFEIKFCVVTGLQVYCKDVHNHALNQMPFITILFMWALLYNE